MALKYDCVLFDFDGTIADTGEGIRNSVAYSLEKLGRPALDRAALDRFIGPPLHDSFMEQCGMTEDEAVRAVAVYRERYIDIGLYESHLYPGVAMLLRVNNQVYRTFFHWCAIVLMHTFPASPFRVKNREKALPLTTPAVYIANHTSLFDILAAVSVQKNLTIITQQWVFSNPFFAPIARKANFLPASTGYEQMVDQLREEVKKGNSVLIYREGSRSRNGALMRFHRGAFYSAEQLHIPIQPMLIEGTFNIMSKGELIIGKAKASLSFMDPIYLDDGQWGETYREATHAVHELYKKQLTHY